MEIKYIELNEKIERMSKIVHFFIVKVVYVQSFLPPILITMINYFIYDLKDDSFYMVIPMMFVRIN